MKIYSGVEKQINRAMKRNIRRARAFVELELLDLIEGPYASGL